MDVKSLRTACYRHYLPVKNHSHGMSKGNDLVQDSASGPSDDEHRDQGPSAIDEDSDDCPSQYKKTWRNVDEEEEFEDNDSDANGGDASDEASN